MPKSPKLAPHDAELIEADAERYYLDSAPPGRAPCPWADCPEFVRAVFRWIVVDPYGAGQLPR